VPKPPTQTKPILPMEVRLRVADRARIPDRNREDFCDVIQLPVQLIWELDRRAIGTATQEALTSATEAARALREAFENLSPEDREWVEGTWAKWPMYEKWLPVLPRSVEALAHLFSVAVNKAPPQGKSGPRKRGRRTGDVKDLSFRQFVHYLLVVTEKWCGGDLTVDKNNESGSLIETIEILRPYLPPGVVPIILPVQTIQRVKANPGHYTGIPDINFFRIE
jgi:hypothetical protein